MEWEVEKWDSCHLDRKDAKSKYVASLNFPMERFIDLPL